MKNRFVVGALLAAFLFFVSPLTAAAQNGDTDMEAVTVDEGLEIIHPLIEKAMRESGTPGMSLVVVTPEETVFRNYGYADREQETAADSSTLFELGSMSKAFTALGILLLEQEGKLGLDDDIREYIPWLALQFNGNYKGQKIDG